MRLLLALTLITFAIPLVARADSSSIVDLNSTATPDPSATASPTPTVAPVVNPVTGASPWAGVIAAGSLALAAALYASQRRQAHR